VHAVKILKERGIYQGKSGEKSPSEGGGGSSSGDTCRESPQDPLVKARGDSGVENN